MEQILDTYESANSFIGPPTSHKPDKLRSARIDRLETIVGKVADTVGSIANSIGQLSNQLGKMSLNDQSRKLSTAVIADRKVIRKIIAPS
jgi:hypothetical protein